VKKLGVYLLGSKKSHTENLKAKMGKEPYNQYFPDH
jgi:hypothetical protein